MNRSVSISSTNSSAKKQTTTLNYVNPNASDSDLESMARQIINLTTNSYNSATKIDKTELKTKLNPNFSINPATNTLQNMNSNSQLSIRLTYDGNDRRVKFGGQRYSHMTFQQTDAKTISSTTSRNTDTGDSSAILTITLESTETYQESTVTFTLTGVNSTAIVDVY